MTKINIEEVFEGWENTLRHKASEYEHEARKNNEIVSSPSIDTICNEMRVFLAALKWKEE